MSSDKVLLDPRPWPEGSYELGTDLSSIRLLSGSFLGIGSLVFSEFLYGVMDP